MKRPILCVFLFLALTSTASAEVTRIDVQRRDDAGTHERVIGRVYFAIDPALPANRGIADLDRAPRNANGKIEFSSDLLFFRPKDARKARGAVFLEVVNRGRDQSLAIMSGAQQRDLSPEAWNLGDGSCSSRGSPWRSSGGSSMCGRRRDSRSRRRWRQSKASCAPARSRWRGRAAWISR